MTRTVGRSGVSALLLLSGALSILGARERWWPACRPGDFDAPDCLRLQDSAYNYLWSSHPHIPIGNAAGYAGASLLVFALAAALLPFAVLRGQPLWATLLGAVLGLPLATSGAATVYQQLHGAPVEGGVFFVVMGATWFLVWPVALLGVGLRSWRENTAVLRGWAWTLLIGSLFATTPLLQVVLPPMMLGYASYDTTPWSEATLAVWLFAAAVALLRVPVRRGVRGLTHPDSP